MPIQSATTGNLENAQRIAIAEARFTEEHNMPVAAVVEHMTLKQGEKQVTVPKVAQMNASDLVDGEDMVDSEDIGMTTTDLTTAEVGLKVILTDKLLRQENESVFRIVGRQMGDAMARKKEEKLIALFSALNGGANLGADDKNMTAQNIGAAIAIAKTKKFPKPISIIHHPNAVFALTSSLAPVGSTAAVNIPRGFSEDLLRDFFAVKLSQIPIFETGNIEKITGSDSGYGAILSRAAMVLIESKGQEVENERDASLRAWEAVITSDYGVFELDDGYGAPLRFEIGDPSTSN
ncbi:hypothetical protein LCGC14_0651300 [marine sediment metagenome]|uniref:Phage major capsid protein n=1 Tax=marine sediment metagenome TaxID=412755 RepID=A0A0F9QW50_9ZZZZ